MDDVAKFPGLVKRGEVFYFRRRVPTHLVAAHGSDQIMVSLKTKDRKKAEDAWLIELANAKAEFSRLEELLAHPGQPVKRFRLRSEREALRQARYAGGAQHLPPLDEGMVDQLIAEWNAERIKACLAELPPDPPDAAIRWREEEIDFVSIADHDARLLIQQTVDAILIAKKLGGMPGEALYDRLCELLRLAKLEVARFDLARLRGEPVTVPASIASPTAKAAGSAAPANGDPGKTIKKANEDFFAWKKADKPNLKEHSYNRIAKGLQLAVEFFGPDTPLSDINVERCEAYRQFLRDLPPNNIKLESGLPLLQVVEFARKRKKRGLAPATRAGYFGTFRAMLVWAAGRKFIPFDPAATVDEPYPKGRGDGQAPRYSYTPAQLRTIFAAPLYVGCVDDEQGFNTPGPSHPRRGRFWAPLLGLFTGARLGELCQLRINDVMVSEKGTPYIRIHAEGKGMSVKNQGSWRSLPIHPELQRIGFLDFVSQAREKGQNALFPEMLVEGRSAGYRLSKLYGYFLKAIRVKIPGVVYHSFRHTVRDCHRECDIPQEISEELCGWKNNNRTSNRYGEGSTMDRLYRHLCRMTYEGLDLSHLYTGVVAVKPPSPAVAAQVD